MENIKLEELKKSTKLLSRLYNNEMALIQKLEIIEQVSVNLKILKSELSAEDYSENFEKLERSTNDAIERLTNPSFINSIIEKLKGFLDLDSI